ncbi:carnitine O-palmitoyltransferase 1, liver isoform-like [Chironomus tepperi]|uniref:carnitine O-palmitoyltransferase 1, liver isoform-like n=1 Tax=Chironomus tepperi TaxID=113505 RepID=UPI00391F2355
MAEAHQATTYSDVLIHEHTEANHDQEVLQLVFKSGIRSWRKRFARFRSKVKNGVYPAHLESLWIIVAMAMGFHFYTQNTPFDVVKLVIKFMPNQSLGWEIVACTIAGLFYWLLVAFLMRFTLKMLLTYRGFLFEARGRKVTMKTKIWAILLKVFIKWNSPNLFSFQETLPRLPVPPVKDTMKRYLRSVRPLLDDKNYERVAKEAEEFEKGIGKKLQRYLVLKSWWATNYVSDWWEEYVYHKSRHPLLVNSNIYGTDCVNHPTKDQAARVANLIYLCMQFRRKIIRQELQPIMVQGMVPLCSYQYERLFNTARIPGVDGDKLIHNDDAHYMAIRHKGVFYKLPVQHNGRMLNAKEIEYQVNYILKSNNKASHAEEYLGSLTAWDRTKWAETRNKYFSKGVNKASLDVIESSIFFFNLHDKEYDMDFDDSAKMKVFSKECLHGQIFDFWFDKSFCMSVGTNARYAMNAEHSWADAPILGHLYEEVQFDDQFSYDENGKLLGTMECTPPLPTRLKWDFSDEQLVKNIDQAYSDALKITSDVDHMVLKFDDFGKGFIKTCKVSPDAFIQMALQLAYFRDFGKFSLTYEASMTRLYREGRTETVRSCSIESCAWVRAMEDEKVSSQEKVRLLRVACERHQQLYLEAMTGKGVDRHIFCLYVISKYLEIDSPFLKEVLSEPWRLSTSQTPHGQSPRTDLVKYPGLVGSGGGFGPVSYDGYSVSYIVSGENRIFFHLSSTISCPLTNTERFSQRITKALGDIKALFVKLNAEQKLQKNGVS